MTTHSMTEAEIAAKDNLLVTLSPIDAEELKKNFLGSVWRSNDSEIPSLTDKTIYLAGDLDRVGNLDLSKARSVFAIEELCENKTEINLQTEIQSGLLIECIRIGQVPLSVHGMGILYRAFFDPNIDYFNRIRSEHEFQSLTESTKPGVAHRTGVYLTPVEKQGDELHFHLLRCSTNFSGPSENFRSTDTEIVNALNQTADSIFNDHAPMNHVLAQIYHNRRDEEKRKETKAKIKAHADKTKDHAIERSNGFLHFL